MTDLEQLSFLEWTQDRPIARHSLWVAKASGQEVFVMEVSEGEVHYLGRKGLDHFSTPEGFRASYRHLSDPQ